MNMRVPKNSWIIILVFTLIPLFVLSFFNLPMGDDFYFGKIARESSIVDAVAILVQ